MVCSRCVAGWRCVGLWLHVTEASVAMGMYAVPGPSVQRTGEDGCCVELLRGAQKLSASPHHVCFNGRSF